MPGGSKKVIYAAIFGNAAIAVSKFAAALLTGSSAMLSEAFHSTVDTVNELLLLLGHNRSQRPPDEAHPFGHGRELYFWAVIVSASIFAFGGGVSIYEGVLSFLHPHAQESVIWNYSVLAIAACFEGYSWHKAYSELRRRQRAGETLWQRFRRSKDPAVYTVFVEDTAALAGLAAAFAGVLASHLAANPYYDAGASVLIGLILVVAALLLMRENGQLLVGESADMELVDSIKEIARRQSGVNDIGKVMTMQLGPDEVLLTMNVNFADEFSANRMEESIDALEAAIRQKHPEVKQIFLEADALKGTRAA